MNNSTPIHLAIITFIALALAGVAIARPPPGGGGKQPPDGGTVTIMSGQCPDSPADVVECELPNGCVGFSSCYGTGRWTSCVCAGEGPGRCFNGCGVQGTWNCSETCQVISACTACTTEVCDGCDNDCNDGVSDEAALVGPACTKSNGCSNGRQQCVNGAWSTNCPGCGGGSGTAPCANSCGAPGDAGCDSSCVPALSQCKGPEVCNGTCDDDRDGKVDEDLHCPACIL